MPKILVVEDEKSLLAAIQIKLQNEGYEVLTATDGLGVVDKVKNEKPDAILLDIFLPGKSGMDILEDLNREGILKSLPVIIISNSGQNVEIERSQKLGVKDFLVKTDFTPQDVLDKLNKFVSSPKSNKTINMQGETKNQTPTAQDQGGIRGLVLVVEDDAFLRKLLVNKLKKDGFEVAEATSGKEALEFLKGKLPIIVLLDLVMPGIDGFQVLEEMRRNPETKELPVIVLSNLGEPEQMERTKRLGVDDYLVKAHFFLDEIQDKIDKVIAKRYL
ncbi:MAG: response regulator [bacterium]|nr:response regulator [bacterium]